MKKTFLKLALIFLTVASIAQLGLTIYIWMATGISWYHLIMFFVLISLLWTLIKEYRK